MWGFCAENTQRWQEEEIDEEKEKTNKERDDAYIVHDCRPAFHRDALEHGQHRQAEVVEVGDASVWSDPVEVADPPALGQAAVTLPARPRYLHRYHVYTAIRRYPRKSWSDRNNAYYLSQSHLNVIYDDNNGGDDKIWQS